MSDRAERRAFGSALRIALAACAWGTWSLFFRPIEARYGTSPALETFVIFSMILVVGAPLALRDRPRKRRALSLWCLLGAQGVFDALNALLFFAAMQKTTLAVAVLTHYLAPVLVALAAPFVVSERIQPRTWAVLGLALSGLGVLLEPWRGVGGGVWWGALLGAGSTVFFTGSLLLAKRLGSAFAPTEIMAWHMPTALLTLLFFLPTAVLSTPLPAFAPLILAGLGPGALAGIVFIRALPFVDASKASILMLLEPVVAVCVGIAAFHEVPRPAGLAGGAMVLSAAYLVLARARRAA